MRKVAVIPNLHAERYYRITCLSILVAVLLSFYSQARASDTTNHQATQAEFDRLYSELLKNPSNVDLTLQYAEVAVQLNDYEAAIPPLERLVMMNPKLYKTKLKLGVFYSKLGSKLVAKSYFSDVVEAPDAPPELVSEAKTLLNNL